MKVLTLKLENETHEIHMLNPGDAFPHFGGSKRDLVAHKTGSIVIHRRSTMSTHDTELDIYAPEFWSWMARLINEAHPIPIAEA